MVNNYGRAVTSSGNISVTRGLIENNGQNLNNYAGAGFYAAGPSSTIVLFDQADVAFDAHAAPTHKSAVQEYVCAVGAVDPEVVWDVLNELAASGVDPGLIAEIAANHELFPPNSEENADEEGGK